MKKTQNFIFRILQFSSALGGIFFLAYSLFPFQKIKSFFDIFTPDKNLEAFTLEIYRLTAPLLLLVGILFFLLFALLQFFPTQCRETITAFLGSLESLPTRLRDDFRSLWGAAKQDILTSKDWLILLALMILSGVFHALLLNQPMTHDEAYTYIGFISRGFWAVISDYHLPNNHILYSVFAYLSVHLFGNAPWTMRFPAFLAGIALIPAIYLAARNYFNRETALLSSGIIAIFPVFALYGVSARGYAQLALLSVLLWWLANRLLREKNLFLWLLFILVAAAGFYTIPIMLYPFTALMAWLFLRYLLGSYASMYTKGQFFKYLFFAGLTVVILFLVLYMPVFVRTGIRSVFYSDTIKFAQEANLELLKNSIITRSIRAWAEWHKGLPKTFRQITLFGFLLSFFLHPVITKKWGSYLTASFLAILGIVLIQRTFAWTRVWFFFAPIYFSFAAAGWTFLLRQIKRPRATFGLLSLFLLSALFFSLTWLVAPTQEMRELRGQPAALERGIIYLHDRIQPEDALVASSAETPAMQYYAAYYGIPLKNTHPADNTFKSIYAIVTSPSATLEETLHSGTSDRVDLTAAELLYQEGDLRIYKIPIVIFYAE